jgi:hypothetical protein
VFPVVRKPARRLFAAHAQPGWTIQSPEVVGCQAEPDRDNHPPQDGAVSVDAKEVLRRADSPLFAITAPNDNIFGLEPGSYDAVADGLWATVPPLSKGKHTIHFELSAPNVGITQDNTYHLTVKRANPAP